jgi:Flp pilus assembly protein TadB
MSKERARRREAREREAAIVAAARASQAERRERRAARGRALESRLPRRRPRPTGVLAARRRRQTGATVALLLVLNVVVWFVFPEWAARAMVLIVSLLAAPVLHTLLFRRR